MKTITNIQKWFFALLLLSLTQAAQAKPTIEDYGNLPQLTDMSLSPSGKRAAYIRDIEGERSVIVIDTETKKLIGGTRFGKMKTRGLDFISENLVLFVGSETTRFRGQDSDTELTATFVYNIEKGKSKIMLKDNEGLSPGSAGNSGIARIDRKAEIAYMNALEGFYGSNNPINLYKVNLITGKGKRYARGTSHTLSWILNGDNELKARIDYHSAKQEFRIFSLLDKKEKQVFTKKSFRPEVDSVALMPDQKSLIVIDNEGVFTVDLTDGKTAPYTDLLEGEVPSGLLTGGDEVFSGIRYTGLRPFNKYLDSDRQATYDMLRGLYPNSAVNIIGQTEDKNKLVLSVSGSDLPGSYLIYDKTSNRLVQAASRYPNIKKDDIGLIQSIEYKARDGMTIPAVLTWPVGADTPEKKKNLPLIVLPHGGPESHDTVRFDWWSQFLANKGYLVLQPNFRGSTGFGWAHTQAGHGKWGQEMQDDVSDGVLAMIEAGYADKDRVCIMGASYGGYAAFAGAAFTPELYKCSVAVAGVSDIHQMLARTKNNAGSHWIVRHWQTLMGESKDDPGKLKRTSPINSVDNVAAPMLILHGDDDTVVPLYQSKIMHSAMKKAKKDSKYVVLKGEDHWLSRSETRLQMIQEIDAFLDKYNPASI